MKCFIVIFDIILDTLVMERVNPYTHELYCPNYDWNAAFPIYGPSFGFTWNEI